MRILKGKYAGRNLTSPGRAVRPTPEPMRDRALALIEEELEGARVLDLFAGSGAVGLEALSRGARYVDFVENGPAALHALKANIAALRVRNATRIFKRDAIPWVEKLEAGAYDVAYMDPPYGSRKLDLILERWKKVPFATTLLVEHDVDQPVPIKGPTHGFDGPTRVTILRARPPVRSKPG
jgi:16S rRNA (guanine966-N2)-methyltransferase